MEIHLLLSFNHYRRSRPNKWTKRRLLEAGKIADEWVNVPHEEEIDLILKPLISIVFFGPHKYYASFNHLILRKDESGFQQISHQEPRFISMVSCHGYFIVASYNGNVKRTEDFLTFVRIDDEFQSKQSLTMAVGCFNKRLITVDETVYYVAISGLKAFSVPSFTPELIYESNNINCLVYWKHMKNVMFSIDRSLYFLRGRSIERKVTLDKPIVLMTTYKRSAFVFTSQKEGEGQPTQCIYLLEGKKTKVRLLSTAEFKETFLQCGVVRDSSQRLILLAFTKVTEVLVAGIDRRKLYIIRHLNEWVSHQMKIVFGIKVHRDSFYTWMLVRSESRLKCMLKIIKLD